MLLTPFSRASLALTGLLLATGCAGSIAETDASRTTTTTAAAAETTAPTTAAGATDVVPTGSLDPGGQAVASTAAPDEMASTKAANKLVLSTEVQTITGRRVMAMPSANNAVRFVEKAAAGDTATVAFVAYATPTVFDDTRTAAASKTNGGHLSRVSGLGEAAYFDATNGTLYVKAKDQVLLVGLPMTLPGKDRRSAALQLGRLATARL